MEDDLEGSPGNADLNAELAELVAMSQPPELPQWMEDRRLYACGTETGLILIYSQFPPLQKAIERKVPLVCHQVPSGDEALIPVQLAIPVPKDQTPFWGWAAERCKILFGV